MDEKRKSRRGRPRSTKSESEKKRAKRERNQRYRQNTSVISITTDDAGKIRRIGEEEGMSDKEVVTLLISLYNQGQGLPSGIKEERTQIIPESKTDRSGTSISGIEQMSGSDIDPEPESESLQSDTRPHVQDELPAETTQEQDQANTSFEAIEMGDFIYPLEDISDDEEVEIWHPSYYHERSIAKSAERIDVVEEVFGIVEEREGEEEEERQGEEEEEERTQTLSGLHRIVKTAEEAQQSKLYFTTEGAVKVLAAEARPKCKVCSKPTQVTIKPSGTSGHIEWSCNNGHIDRFCLQETLHRNHVGDLKMATSILVSGNNYLKVRHMAEVMGLHPPSSRFFYAVQNHYVCPEVEETFSSYLKKKADELEGKEVVVCGDARNDSPGFRAQYCTYTLLENDTKDIVDVQFCDKREAADKSPNMEPLALVRALEAVKKKGVHLTELVTDANMTISALIKRDYPELTHSWDIWHGAKNLAKKLAKASSTAKTKPLKYWTKHVVKHFWHCAETCGGSVDLFYSKWQGIVHHVCNKHEWILTEGFGGQARCEHGDLQQREEWLLPQSPPHKALVQLVMDKKFLNTLVKFVNFRHTGELESLHNHILMYCSKRYSFGYAAYRARNLLAMIDYQEHKDRPLAMKENGDPKVRSKWSKHAGEWVPYKVRTNKKYDYMPGMMTRILERRLKDNKPLYRPPKPLPTDPRQIRRSLAPYPRPPMEDLLDKRKSRFH